MHHRGAVVDEEVANVLDAGYESRAVATDVGFSHLPEVVWFGCYRWRRFRMGGHGIKGGKFQRAETGKVIRGDVMSDDSSDSVHKFLNGVVMVFIYRSE